jgi:hypothetical protein
MIKHILPFLFLSPLLFQFCNSPGNTGDAGPAPSFTIEYPENLEDSVLDGRLMLMLSTDDSQEPRFQISDGPDTQLLFGMDVENWEPGTSLEVPADAFGYPIQSLAAVPEKEYNVQILFHKYSTFNLSTGHTVKLPMDQGEGQQWNRSPKNLISTPRKVNINNGGSYNFSFDQEIPPIEPPKDTRYIKHIKIQSKMLTEFWGRPMYLGAAVLVPHGIDEHPEARYPLMVFHGHYPKTFGGFRTEPPNPDLKPDFSERFGVEGYNKIQQQEAYDLYQQWTSDDFPRFIAIEIQHQNPYYDDSYAVNSANLGPYGDAITYELIPYIEEQFQGIGEGWARYLYGGSTGGWEALAVQVKYPDEYNACFAACPDPIDFNAYTVVDIYNDENAYFLESEFKKTERPGKRDSLGHVSSTLREMNMRELALGTNSRSGQQWDIWEAVYSPQGEDGYPQRIWDKKTGEINKEVAEYWRENYDMQHILERDWETLGPKLEGKLHIYCGDMDNYYLNNAVMLMEDYLESTTDPYYNGEVAYGDRKEHCWNGDPELPNHISRLRYNTMYLPKILNRIEESAPEGADLSSWRY